MTDKQIIDGVDVSKCEYFGPTMSSIRNCTMDSEYLHSCRGYNCYYKQLTHKTQECEELKNRSDEWMSKCEQETKLREFTNEQLDQLKAENEELKGEIKHYKQIAQHHGNLSVKYTNKSARLKQTLAEIKDFVENKMIPNEDTHIILQLISEVEHD